MPGTAQNNAQSSLGFALEAVTPVHKDFTGLESRRVPPPFGQEETRRRVPDG
jgi:hypothetical protein